MWRCFAAAGCNRRHSRKQSAAAYLLLGWNLALVPKQDVQDGGGGGRGKKQGNNYSQHSTTCM
jgi:hypothetical protein